MNPCFCREILEANKRQSGPKPLLWRTGVVRNRASLPDACHDLMAPREEEEELKKSGESNYESRIDVPGRSTVH